MPFWRRRSHPATSCKTGCAPGGRGPGSPRGRRSLCDGDRDAGSKCPRPGGRRTRHAVGAFDRSGPRTLRRGADTEVAIEFSEGMTRTGLERLLSFRSGGGDRIGALERDVLVVRPREPLHRDTTYVVTSAKDSGRPQSGEQERHQFAFARRGDRFRHHHGHGPFSAQASARACPVFRLAGGLELPPAAARPDRQDVTDAEGFTRSVNLGRATIVSCVGVRRCESERDVRRRRKRGGAFLPDTVVLSGGFRVRRGRDVWIVIRPNRPSSPDRFKSVRHRLSPRHRGAAAR